MEKIVFEDTTVVKSPYVEIDGIEYEVNNGTYQGGTDLNAQTFNQMQDNFENAINSVDAGDELGTIKIFSGTTAPNNWLICDGSAISRNTYSDLFAFIGTTFGEGDGSSTFNLPNLKGKVVVGLDNNDSDFNTIGKTGGEKKHTMTVEELVGHDHGIIAGYTGSGSAHTYFTNNSGDAYLTTETTGESEPFNVMQPYMALNYIIKVKSSGSSGGGGGGGGTSTNDYSATETVIGTWFGKTLYRNTLIIPSASVHSAYTTIDIKDLNADNIFIDETHSYYLCDEEYDGVIRHTFLPINYISLSQNSTATTIRNQSANISYMMIDDNNEYDEIGLYIGSSVAGDITKIYLTIEYTKSTD